MKQSHSIAYHIEGILLVPLHELLHYTTGLLLGVQIQLHPDSVTFDGSNWIKNMLITIAPIVFSIAFGGWAIFSFWYSARSISSIVIMAIQLFYALLHLEMCRHDVQDAFHLIVELYNRLIGKESHHFMR